jgi:hypothetical protein
LPPKRRRVKWIQNFGPCWLNTKQSFEVEPCFNGLLQFNVTVCALPQLFSVICRLPVFPRCSALFPTPLFALSLSLSLSQSHIFGLSLHVISVAPCALRISNLYDVPLCGIVMVLHNLISVGSPAPNNLLAFLVLTYIIFYSSYLVFYLLYLFFFSVPFCLNNLISACLIY